MRHLRNFSLLAAVVCAGHVGAAAARPMNIASAVYGSLPNGRTCDATRAVASLCEGRSACVVPIGNALCGDSDFLVVKSAQITYACGRDRRALVASEYTSAALACE